MAQEFDNGEYEINDQQEPEEQKSCGCGKKHIRKDNQVMMGTVDGHTMGTMTCYVKPDLDVCEINMRLSFMDINLFIQEQGGVPLQLKASMKDADTVITLNMVGADIIRGEGKTDLEIMKENVKINLLVMAEGIETQVLKAKLEELMGYFVNNSF